MTDRFLTAYQYLALFSLAVCTVLSWGVLR